MQAQQLVDEIERGALDSSHDLADVLRKCMALGGQSGSARLREWASTELKGYPEAANVPSYRVVPSPLLADYRNGAMMMNGQQLSTSLIPEWAQEHVNDEVRFTQGVGELSELVFAARNGDTPTFGPAGAADLVAYMNAHTVKWPAELFRIYYKVSAASIAGVLDAVRTILVELVAEIRAGLPTPEAIPTEALADQAVNVAVYGDNSRVTFVSSSAGPASAVVDSPKASTVQRINLGTKLRRSIADHPWVTLAAAAGSVVAAVAGVWALFLA